MDVNIRRNVVTNEIIELEHLLLERLQYQTERSGIGLTNVAMRPEQELCQNLLVDGKPQAFVELFNITTTLKIDSTPKEDEEAGILNPIAEAQKKLKKKETLSILSENLVAAELASRVGDNERSFLANSGIGEIFDKTCYFEKAIEYISRGLAAAVLSKNDVQVSQAKFNLGNIYWKMHNSGKAIESYEECLALARTIKDEKRAVLAAKELLEIYWHCAERSRVLQDFTGSIEYFEKCIYMAEACDNGPTGAEAKYNIGMLYAKLRNLEKSIEYQSEYLDYSSSVGNMFTRRRASVKHELPWRKLLRYVATCLQQSLISTPTLRQLFLSILRLRQEDTVCWECSTKDRTNGNCLLNISISTSKWLV